MTEPIKEQLLIEATLDLSPLTAEVARAKQQLGPQAQELAKSLTVTLPSGSGGVSATAAAAAKLSAELTGVSANAGDLQKVGLALTQIERAAKGAAAAQSNSDVERYLRSLQASNDLLQLSSREREQYAALLKVEELALRAGTRATDEQLTAALRLVEANQALRASTEAATSAEELNVAAVQREAAERARTIAGLRSVIEARAAARAEQTAQTAGAETADAIAQEERARARVLALLRQDIETRAAESAATKQGRGDLEAMLAAYQEEGVLLRLDAREREVVIATRRAEQVALKAGITDHRQIVDLIALEVRKNQELRAATAGGGRLNLGGITSAVSFLPGTGQIGQVALQAQQGASALTGMAEAAGASAAALGPIAAAGAAIAGTVFVLYDAARASHALDEGLRIVSARSQELFDRAGELKTRIRELSAETGKSQEELAQGLSAVVQNGVSQARTAVDFLRVATDAAKATGESIPAAAGAVDSVLDAFNLKADRAREIADFLVVGAREGETTFSRYAGALQKAGVVTGELGVDMTETAAVLATVARRTGNVDTAASAVVNVLQKLTGETDPTRQKLLALGVDASAAALRTKGLLAVLEDVRAKVGERKDILSDLFGGQRVASTFFAAISDTDGARRSMEALARSEGEVEAASKRAATAGEEFAKAWAELRRSSGLDDIGDGLVLLGGRIAKFTADFLRDHQTLTTIALSSTGALGLAALYSRAQNAPTALDNAADAIRDLGRVRGPDEKDDAAQRYGRAAIALGEFNRKLVEAREDLAKLRDLERSYATSGTTFSDEYKKKIADLEAFIATGPIELVRRVGNQPATAYSIPLRIPIAPSFDLGTLRKEADRTRITAEGVVHELGSTRLEMPIGVVPVPVVQSTGVASFDSDRLKRDLERTLAEFAADVGPVEVPARIVQARTRVEQTLANPELLKFPQLDPDTARANEAIREFTQNQNQATQLQLDLQARAARGTEQQRIQYELANLAIARQITALRIYGFNVAQLERAFDALKRTQADALDAASMREAAQAAAQLAASIQETVAQRVALAQSRGDSVGADQLSVELERAKGDALRAASEQRIADLRTQALSNDETKKNLDALVAGERERLTLALALLGVDRERSEFERGRAAAFQLAEAQRGVLRGTDARVADIRISLARQLAALDDEARKNSEVAAIRERVAALYRRSADEQERLARVEAEGAVVDRRLGLLQQTARTYREQLALVTLTEQVERGRLEVEFQTSAELAKQRTDILALRDLAQRQRVLDLGVSESQRPASQQIEQERYNAAFNRTVVLLGEGAVGSREFGETLVHYLRESRRGVDALRDGLRGGVEDMRRAFADDLSFGIQAATEQMRTFRDAGVSAMEDVLDGEKSLGDGLNDFLIAQLKQARRSALEFGFNKLGTAVFGAPDGGQGGLFGGLIDKVLGKGASGGGDQTQIPEEILRRATDDFGRYVQDFGLAVRTIPATTFGPSANAQVVSPDFNGPLADNQVRARELPPGFVGPPANDQVSSGIGEDVAGAASDTLEDGARVAGKLIADGALRGSLSIQQAGFSLLQSFGNKIGNTLGDKAGSAAATALGFSQGGRVFGMPVRVRDAAQGTVARSEQYFRVAELPGLEELIAPLDRGRLPAHLDEHGGLRVRVRGAEVPIDVRGGSRAARGQRAVDVAGLRARDDDAPRAAPRARGENGPVSVHVNAGAPSVGDIHITVQGGNGRDVVQQIRSQMGQIARDLAADLENGYTNALREAIKGVVR